MEYMTYEEYKEAKVEYPKDTVCEVMNCDAPGLYEGGDARCRFAMCEKHVRLKEKYERLTKAEEKPLWQRSLEMAEKALKELKKELKNVKD